MSARHGGWTGARLPLPASHHAALRWAFVAAADFAAQGADVAERLIAEGAPPGWCDLVSWEPEARRIAGVVGRRKAA